MAYPFLVKFQLLREIEEACTCFSELSQSSLDHASKDSAVDSLLNSWITRNSISHESFDVQEPILHLRLIVAEEIRKQSGGKGLTLCICFFTLEKNMFCCDFAKTSIYAYLMKFRSRTCAYFQLY